MHILFVDHVADSIAEGVFLAQQSEGLEGGAGRVLGPLLHSSQNNNKNRGINIIHRTAKIS
jgi:hypothetical protein